MALLLRSHCGTNTRFGLCALALGCLLLATTFAPAQEFARVQVKSIDFGFSGYPEEGRIRPFIFKPGVWAPLHVTFDEVKDGTIKLPIRPGPDPVAEGVLRVEVADSDGIPNAYSVPFRYGPKDLFPVQTYARTGESSPEVTLKVLTRDRDPDRPYTVPPQTFHSPVGLGSSVYLTLGAPTVSLQTALVALHKGKKQNDWDTPPWHAAYEEDATKLPTQWFGYSMADLVILTTGTDKFLTTLSRNPERLGALAEWTRRGGRLIVSVSWRNQDLVAQLLKSPVWQPALPPMISPGKHLDLAELGSVQSWAGAFDHPFPVPRGGTVSVARLQPGKDAEVLIRENTGETLMARVPYGRGSVTLIAFELESGPFTTWGEGQTFFWKEVITKLAPKQSPVQDQNRGGYDPSANDVTTRLERELDNFDVPVISFGWVALFILLYILIVGPLDYLILKKVFKRLEWTWITFPTVVLVVSIVAYFTAYALKGNDLRINKVDLVDIDLRSDLDEELKPRRAYAYGTTWFSILSPRIQNYTIGVEPALGAWLAPVDDPAEAGVMVTWLGRPENYGLNGMGRQRSQSLFRRTYDYAPGATGLMGVPIPVWTTKAFTASWAVPFKQLPLVADLSYDPGAPGAGTHLVGTIKSNLPVDLDDVYLFYGNKFYPLGKSIPGSKSGGGPIQVATDGARAKDLNQWVSGVHGQQQIEYSPSGRSYNPTVVVKEILFHERTGTNMRNHLFRGLDESWRLGEFPARQEKLRDAMLVARLARVEGPADTLTSSQDPRLATHLWLGELPGKDDKGKLKERPRLIGNLVQDTYVRVLLPVRPKR